jgi:uncharacterized tellurite resistance protein B-like protein
MASPQTWKTFYQRLAYLYYAVAKADEKVVAEEIAKVHEVVKNDWLSIEPSEDEFGTDAAYQIDIAFDWLLEQKPSAGKALEKFENFVAEHPDFLTTKLKKRIIRTSTAIAEAFHGTNKQEETMLQRLEALLNK